MAITWRDIFNLNQDQITDPNLIYPGQELTMPPPAGGTYTVVKGDYLSKIARKWNEEHPDEPEAEEEPAEEPEAEEPPKEEPKPPAKEKPKEQVDPTPTLKIRPNPLHKYATYTYSVALYILSQADINQLTKNPSTWVPGAGGIKTCLIASGGKNSGAYARNDNFKDDFYFENVTMTTVIGLNNRSKASNAIELGFTVVEPYGMSLLDRIIDTANEIKAPNFKAMPYMLEIDFYGYDDTGKATKIDEQRKRFPIQIIELKIKVSTKGSEYAIKAVPWAHQALSQSAATTPINIEVAASTVSEFFANNDEDYSSISQQDLAKGNAADENQRIEKETQEEKKDASGRRTAASDPRSATYKTEPDKSARTPSQADKLKENQAIVSKAYAVKSFCGGVNGWFTDLTAKRLRATTDKVFVEFHGSKEVPIEKIRDAKITVPARRDVTRSATTTSKPEQAAAQSANPANKVFGDAMAFPVSAGTSIPQVIDMVMRNSSYITDQVSDPKDTKPEEIAQKAQKPLYWYKIVPSVEVSDYDYAINKFSTKTTYHVIPYIVYDSKHPNGPVTSPKGAVKEYSYSYTGKNIDVLDLQIDFDTLFYTAVTAGSAKWQAEQIAQAKQQLDDAQNAAKSNGPAARELVNRQLRLVSAQPQQQGLGGQQGSAEQILAGDMQKSQYSSSRGDMLNLKLKIVGDPELIKQDDIYTNPAQGGYADQVSFDVMPMSGSIPMDNGEVICQVNFRTIMDMDETTGLPRQSALADKSVFSGQYRMLTVANTFSNGKFEQTVDMVRVPDTPAPDKPKTEENKTTSHNGTDADPSSRTPSSGTSGDDLAMFYDAGPTPVEEPGQDGIPDDEPDDSTDDIADDDETTAEDEDLAEIGDSDNEESADEYYNEELPNP